MIRAVIFDFDGVLVESVHIKTTAFARLFEDEGPDVVDRVVAYHIENTGVSRYDKFRYIYKNILGRKLGEGEFGSLCARFAELVSDAVVDAPYVAGAKEFLDKYAGEMSCFVASATPEKEIHDIARRRGMSRYFKEIYGSPMTKDEAVGLILVRNGLSPGETVYVGDALSDYKAAASHQVHFIARIETDDSLFSKVRCPRIRDLTELAAVIGRCGT